MKKTIVEAIKEVMWAEEKPMTIREIHDRIVEKELYQFKAADPIHIVGSQIRRHCEGRDFPSSSKVKHFKTVDGKKFYTLSQPINNAENKTTKSRNTTVGTPASRKQNKEDHNGLKTGFAKMTIVQAIKQVMEAYSRAMTVQEVYDSIVSQNLYNFKANPPIHVVRSQIRRHCLDLDFPSASDIKHFQIHGKDKYSYLEEPIRQKLVLGKVGKNTDVEEIAERQAQLQVENIPDEIRDRVFISYSHKDSKWLQRLQVHLKPLERLGIIQKWDDTQITPGARWREEISTALKRTRVAILLVSADFIASDFIDKNELPPLLDAAASDDAMILPVIVSPCRFDKTQSLSQYQAINSSSKPLIGMDKAKREELFVKIADAVEAALYTV
ncbi:hypothetical protein A6770_08745 [Nostoc minutum NIES-26]|uniref:TIR domain-containing protein n=1 Tax=Nostoc minutum NIES-26 TaxID=1844469 RepID=A0A367S2G5_9NOSO|nr:hypothetical protein A6770_08745 [Nostoc minutum NIES-26]